MVMIVNKTVRLLNIGGIVVSPETPTPIDESFLDNDRIREMMKSGELEEVDEAEAETKPAPAPAPAPTPATTPPPPPPPPAAKG